MFLDYPEYLKIKEKNKWLGVIWQIGDKGYYFGFLGLVIILHLALFAIWFGDFLKGTDKIHFLDVLIMAGASFLLGVVVCFVSELLKAFVHHKGGTYSQNEEGR